MKRWLAAGGLATLAIAGFLLWRAMSGPAVGHIISVKGSTTPLPSQAPGWQTVNGPGADFAYPGNFKSRGPLPSPGPGLVQYAFIGPTDPGALLAITFVSGGPSTAQTYRQQHPELYQMSTKVVQGQTITVARRTDGQVEETAFWPHGDRQAVISLSGDTTQFDQVLARFSWQ